MVQFWTVVEQGSLQGWVSARYYEPCILRRQILLAGSCYLQPIGVSNAAHMFLGGGHSKREKVKQLTVEGTCCSVRTITPTHAARKKGRALTLWVELITLLLSLSAGHTTRFSAVTKDSLPPLPIRVYLHSRIRIVVTEVLPLGPLGRGIARSSLVFSFPWWGFGHTMILIFRPLCLTSIVALRDLGVGIVVARKRPPILVLRAFWALIMGAIFL